MQFRPTSINPNSAEQELWQALKTALEHEPGYAYFGFRPRNHKGQIIKESDVLILHPQWGICAIECKGCQSDQIDYINGDEWHMAGWYHKTINPIDQTREAMFAFKNEVDRFFKRELNRSYPPRINNIHLAALPFVTTQEWQAKVNGDAPTLRGAVLLQEDLAPENLRQKLAERTAVSNQINEKELAQIWSFCIKRDTRRTIARKTQAPNDIVKLINNIQYQSIVRDREQLQVADSIPSGPQRIRGLAGTGKTILLAQRAAKMHYEHPETKCV